MGSAQAENAIFKMIYNTKEIWPLIKNNDLIRFAVLSGQMPKS